MQRNWGNDQVVADEDVDLRRDDEPNNPPVGWRDELERRALRFGTPGDRVESRIRLNESRRVREAEPVLVSF